jgi:hypothetical protein
MSQWGGKPCARCGGTKGPVFAERKFCYRCSSLVKKAAAEKAHRAMTARVYGLSDGDYDKLYEAQNGRCALCQVATGRTKRLAVDHDHATGEVRGILCSVCNRMLGHGRDRTDFFLRVIEYLTAPPARDVLGK